MARRRLAGWAQTHRAHLPRRAVIARCRQGQQARTSGRRHLHSFEQALTRMVFQGQLAVCLLDCSLVRVALYAQDLVKIAAYRMDSGKLGAELSWLIAPIEF
jgi:hypothetical protein